MICSIDSKIFTYCWLLRIAGPHPISEAALGGGLASRTSTLEDSLQNLCSSVSSLISLDCATGPQFSKFPGKGIGHVLLTDRPLPVACLEMLQFLNLLQFV
jgi:hypothetical protein